VPGSGSAADQDVGAASTRPGTSCLLRREGGAIAFNGVFAARMRASATCGSGSFGQFCLLFRPDANRRLPWEQFDEVARDGISRPGLRRKSCERRRASRRRVGRATLGRSRSSDAAESLLSRTLGGLHFLGRCHCAGRRPAGSRGDRRSGEGRADLESVRGWRRLGPRCEFGLTCAA
jgi:hypothetical protein